MASEYYVVPLKPLTGHYRPGSFPPPFALNWLAVNKQAGLVLVEAVDAAAKDKQAFAQFYGAGVITKVNNTKLANADSANWKILVGAQEAGDDDGDVDKLAKRVVRAKTEADAAVGKPDKIIKQEVKRNGNLT